MVREAKVGILVIAAFVVLGAGVFLVSERNNLFTLKNRYSIEFQTVGGLAQGSPVHLDGVGVGSIQRIVLPQRVEQKMLTVLVSADRRYAERIRADSVARIKTLGLLGDKYIDISSGTSNAEIIPDGGIIPAAPPTDVDRLIATGGDAMGNVVAISYSLRHILERMESGEGILGELITDNEAGTRAKEALLAAMESMRTIADQIENGQGTLARLIRDDSLVTKLESSVDHLDELLIDVREGSGLVPALLSDPEIRQKAERLLSGFEETSGYLADLTGAIESGEGLLGRMIKDEEFAEQLTQELQRLLENLRIVSDRIAQSEGTLGLLISDPQVYEAMNDIIVGVDQSSMLRWLVRNRQKKGIEVRYESEKSLLEEEPSSEEEIHR